MFCISLAPAGNLAASSSNLPISLVTQLIEEGSTLSISSCNSLM
jgi:hypothetical protein